MSDFNAKLGRDTVFSLNIGQHSLHLEGNENGMRLSDFAGTNSLLVSSTLFPHTDTYKETWRSPDRVTRNQIDHLVIESCRARVIIDVKSCRGVGCDSEHYMVRIKYRPRISKAGRMTGQKCDRYEVTKLQMRVQPWTIKQK
jgi:hypothetical protein